MTFYTGLTCAGSAQTYEFNACQPAFNPFGAFGAGAPLDDVVITCQSLDTYAQVVTYEGDCANRTQVWNVSVPVSGLKAPNNATGLCQGGYSLYQDHPDGDLTVVWTSLTNTTYQYMNCTGAASAPVSVPIGQCFNTSANTSENTMALDLFMHPAVTLPPTTVAPSTHAPSSSGASFAVVGTWVAAMAGIATAKLAWPNSRGPN